MEIIESLSRLLLKSNYVPSVTAAFISVCWMLHVSTFVKSSQAIKIYIRKGNLNTID